jgi:hypothetical protein
MLLPLFLLIASLLLPNTSPILLLSQCSYSYTSILLFILPLPNYCHPVALIFLQFHWYCLASTYCSHLTSTHCSHLTPNLVFPIITPIPLPYPIITSTILLPSHCSYLTSTRCFHLKTTHCSHLTSTHFSNLTPTHYFYPCSSKYYSNSTALTSLLPPKYYHPTAPILLQPSAPPLYFYFTPFHCSNINTLT